MTQSICPHCNEDFNDVGDAFCPNCHADLSEPPDGDDITTEALSRNPSVESNRPVIVENDEMRAWRSVAAELADQDCTPGMIIVQLKKLGASEELATEITEDALGDAKVEHGVDGFFSMILGFIIAAIGLFITFGTMMAANEKEAVLLFLPTVQ